MPDQPSNITRLSRQQKTGFVLLLLFGVLTVGLGLLQMRNTIYSPFVIRPRQRAVAAHAFLDDANRLRQTDTDKDGINDFDEIELYQTSPYLPDTDSDGVGDRQEIEAGTNPLCVEGKDCAVPAPPPVPGSDIQGSPIPGGDAALNLLDGVGNAISQAEEAAANPDAAPAPIEGDIETILKDPQALRSLLLQTGKFTQEQLDDIDDETILNLVAEIQNENPLLPPSETQPTQ